MSLNLVSVCLRKWPAESVQPLLWRYCDSDDSFRREIILYRLYRGGFIEQNGFYQNWRSERANRKKWAKLETVTEENRKGARGGTRSQDSHMRPLMEKAVGAQISEEARTLCCCWCLWCRVTSLIQGLEKASQTGANALIWSNIY